MLPMQLAEGKMPDLEQRAVTDWLTALHPADEATWPPAIRALETTERAQERLITLGSTLDSLAPIDLPRLRAALSAEPLLPELRAVLAQLGAARALRVLHWLAEVDLPDCNDVFTALTLGSDPGGRALRATLDAATRVATVRRMFAPDRIAALERACADVKEDLA
jgi:hypothetical protein